MVLARVANLFTTTIPGTPSNSLVDDGRRGVAFAMPESQSPEAGGVAVMEQEVDDEAARPPYIHVGASTGTMPLSSLADGYHYRRCWLEESEARRAIC